MSVLVTGAAGFIGSHLSERLIADGETVIGIDALTDYYAPGRKRKNLSALLSSPGFTFVEGDLAEIDLDSLLRGVETTYHLAGQPGVRASWGFDFGDYVRRNIISTQRLLEASKDIGLRKFVYASSSSVYGNVARAVLKESDLPIPYSPYGVTKLAAEHLVSAYHQNFGLPTVSLRFFTVFGPRQRPDMAFQRIVEAALAETEFTVFGDGMQVRDFTYVEDIVKGCIQSAKDGKAGLVYNLGGSNLASLREVIGLIENLSSVPLRLTFREKQKGDVQRTHADISQAALDFGYKPEIDLPTGLKRQFEYHQRSLLSRDI